MTMTTEINLNFEDIYIPGTQRAQLLNYVKYFVERGRKVGLYYRGVPVDPDVRCSSSWAYMRLERHPDNRNWAVIPMPDSHWTLQPMEGTAPTHLPFLPPFYHHMPGAVVQEYLEMKAAKGYANVDFQVGRLAKELGYPWKEPEPAGFSPILTAWMDSYVKKFPEIHDHIRSYWMGGGIMIQELHKKLRRACDKL